jgi:hypothetical protein
MSDEKTNRPTLADLLAYADPAMPKEKRRSLADALAASPLDRERLIGLMAVKRGLSEALPPDRTSLPLTPDCLPMEEMGDFLGGRMPEAELTAYRNHLVDCDPCFERVAFASREAVKMAEGMLAMVKTPFHFKNAVLPSPDVAPAAAAPVAAAPANDADGFSPVDWLNGVFSSWLPAYAFAAALLLAFLWPVAERTPTVTSYGGDVAFSIYEKPAVSGPSFGFSDTGVKTGETPADLTVEAADDGSVLLRWTAVADAAAYGVTLSEVTPAGLRQVYETRTERPEALLPADRLTPGNVYRYRVAGSVGERLFVAAGQFGFAAH